MSTSTKRYVVYMPIDRNAKALSPFYVPDDADVEALASAIYADRDFKRHLEHEMLHLYKVLLR